MTWFLSWATMFFIFRDVAWSDALWRKCARDPDFPRKTLSVGYSESFTACGTSLVQFVNRELPTTARVTVGGGSGWMQTCVPGPESISNWETGTENGIDRCCRLSARDLAWQSAGRRHTRMRMIPLFRNFFSYQEMHAEMCVMTHGLLVFTLNSIHIFTIQWLQEISTR